MFTQLNLTGPERVVIVAELAQVTVERKADGTLHIETQFLDSKGDPIAGTQSQLWWTRLIDASTGLPAGPATFPSVEAFYNAGPRRR